MIKSISVVKEKQYCSIKKQYVLKRNINSNSINQILKSSIILILYFITDADCSNKFMLLRKKRCCITILSKNWLLWFNQNMNPLRKLFLWNNNNSSAFLVPVRMIDIFCFLLNFISTFQTVSCQSWTK